MQLTGRQFLLLKILYDSPSPVPAGELSGLLEVSPRTLRYDINSLNLLGTEPFIQSCRNGYYFDRTPESEQLLKTIQSSDPARIQKQLAMELLQNKECSIYDLCETVYVSESTIYKMVTELIPQFGKFNLRIVRAGETLRIVGDEHAKRTLLAHYIYNDANDLATALNNFTSYFTSFTLNDIREIVVKNFRRFQVHVDDLYLKNIIISIAVSAQRACDGYKSIDLPAPPATEDLFLQEQILRTICNDINSRFHILIAGNDFDSLLAFLSGCIRSSASDEWNPILQDEHFTRKIKIILDNTLSHFGLDADSGQYKDGLYVHIYFMLLRAKAGNFFRNSVSANIKNSHPFLFDIAVYLSYQISEIFHVQLPDDEIGLLAFYIGTNVSTNAKYPRARVVLICQNYSSLREAMLEQLNERFSGQIEVIKCLASFDELPDKPDYDFIISTVENKGRIADYIPVSVMLTPFNQRQIEKELLRHIKRQKKRTFRQTILPYFDRELFFYNDGLTCGKDILNKLNEILLRKDIVPDGYLESVYKREELSSTAFYHRFAVAHSLNVAGNRSVVAYYYSEKTINWFGQDIHLVLLLVSDGNHTDFSRVYNLLFDILLDKSLYEEMIASVSLDELIDCLEKNF